ncbi:MAG: DUF2007 domain-containing protein [Bacteroidetes bacterium]|jgi:hypothetical protein|nr:DUF2007 domain-containing protein [Bacteroidota bacterium]MDA0863202.1 DUF2007 domain-containing protein [Bacteroidota bacterium]MDA1210195.1 DUF2007 domain-containing protein [Bacteroidota bacterium]HCK05413.1 hypothetical protein [Flavobacteriaceae bacterium]
MKRIFTGPSLVAGAITAELNDMGISPVVRNDTQSGAIAGFGGGVLDQVQLLVREDQYEQAFEVAQKFD